MMVTTGYNKGTKSLSISDPFKIYIEIHKWRSIKFTIDFINFVVMNIQLYGRRFDNHTNKLTQIIIVISPLLTLTFFAMIVIMYSIEFP